MKIKELIAGAALLCAGMAFFSCTCAAALTQAEKYTISEFTHIIPLIQGASESGPRMSFSFSLLEAAGLPQGSAYIYDALYDGRSPQQYREAVIAEWQAEYFENAGLAAEPFPAVLNWEYSETMEFQLLNERALQIRREQYVYSGGAHGMGTVRYVVFDRAERRVVQFAEFFREDAMEKAAAVVSGELRRYNNLRGGPELDENASLSQGIFFTDSPGLPDNFFITSDGLGLCWAPYDIAPYVYGTIEILIPWRQIRPLMQHETMELLEKFGIYMFM